MLTLLQQLSNLGGCGRTQIERPLSACFLCSHTPTPGHQHHHPCQYHDRNLKGSIPSLAIGTWIQKSCPSEQGTFAEIHNSAFGRKPNKALDELKLFVSSPFSNVQQLDIQALHTFLAQCNTMCPETFFVSFHLSRSTRHSTTLGKPESFNVSLLLCTREQECAKGIASLNMSATENSICSLAKYQTCQQAPGPLDTTTWSLRSQ